MSLRDLTQISIEIDISETSQKHLKRDVFFVTSLRRLKYISKKMFFCDVFKTSQAYLKKDVFSVTSLRCPKTFLACILVFQKYPKKLTLCDFRRVITISDKTDVEPLETLKKLNVFWEQCIDINQVCHEYQWADICMRVLANKRSPNSNSRCIIYYYH